MYRVISLFLALSLVFLLISCGEKTEDKMDSATTQNPAVVDTANASAKTEIVQPEPSNAVPVKAEPAKTVQPKSSGLKAEAAKPKPKPTYVTLPQGTPIAITLVDSIDTDVDSTGDEFRAVLAQPVDINGRILFDSGALATGVLTHVVESGHLKTPAELSFTLTAIQDNAGNWISIAADTVIEKKDSHTKKEVALIGGGTVVGGIIGKLTKKKGGTAIGAAAGAAVGTAAAAAAGKQDITHHAGETVTFTVQQQTEVAVK